MLFGVILQKVGPGAPEAPYQFRMGKSKQTLETLGQELEGLADGLRRQYPTYEYRTLLGELTHEIEQPKPVVKINTLKKITKEK